jgi:hypothetical protein
MPDYAPWAYAFTELAMISFMEIVEIASTHQDAMGGWREVVKGLKRKKAAEPEAMDDEPQGLPDPDRLSDEEEFELKLLRAVFGLGFILKTKIDGWKLFCERMNVPAFTIWESLPGYERLAKAMAEVDEKKTDFPTAFLAEHMLRFLQNNRPKGFPEPTEDSLFSAEAYADGLDKMLREGVKQRGG